MIELLYDEKEKGCLADLSIPGTAVKLVCPVTTTLDSASGITIMSESVSAKIQAIVLDVQIVEPMTDDQCVKMADSNLVQVKAKVVPREDRFTDGVGTGGDGSGLVRCFVGQKEDEVISGSPLSRLWDLTSMTALANARASITSSCRVWNR